VVLLDRCTSLLSLPGRSSASFCPACPSTCPPACLWLPSVLVSASHWPHLCLGSPCGHPLPLRPVVGWRHALALPAPPLRRQRLRPSPVGSSRRAGRERLAPTRATHGRRAPTSPPT